MQAVDWRFPFQGEGQQDWYVDIFGPGAVADGFGSADASLLGGPTTRRQSLRPATGGGLPKDSRMRDGRTIPSTSALLLRCFCCLPEADAVCRCGPQ